MRTPLGLAMLVAAFAIGACGGGGGGGPTKADYIARADKICRAAHKSAVPLIAQLTSAGTSLNPAAARKLAAVADRLHSIQAGYLAQLRALEQPSGDKKTIEAFLTPAGQVVGGIGNAAGSLSRGDVTTTLGLLAQAQGAGAEAKNAADAYGFKECGAALALVS